MLVPPPPAGPFATWDDLLLLAAMVRGEARGEPLPGQHQVAGVALARAAHPTWWGRTLHDVLLRDTDGDGTPEQFSCFRPLPKGGQAEIISRIRTVMPDHTPDPDDVADWTRAVQVAAATLFRFIQPSYPTATHYYAWKTIAAPSWTRTLTPLGRIGGHAFFGPPL